MRSPDEWQKVFADLPRRKDLDRRAAAERAAKHYRINEQEGKLNPCMNCGVATAATPTGAGQSTVITAAGTLTLCMRCSYLDRRAQARKRARKRARKAKTEKRR